VLEWVAASTHVLVEAVDVAERKRGFKPPIFVDIRLRRNVRAKGFSGDAFERVLGAARYQHMPRLGNKSIVTGKSGIQIADPSAVVDLLRPPETARSILLCLLRPRYQQMPQANGKQT
jgi:hypothetical protein